MSLAPNDYRISRSALGHITRQLGHADRDCASRVLEATAAGPALVLQKRENQWEWDKWRKRRDEGGDQLAQIITRFFQDAVGCEAQYEDWKELRSLGRQAGKLPVPFVLEDPQVEAKKALRRAWTIAVVQLKRLSHDQVVLVNGGPSEEPREISMGWVGRERRNQRRA